MIIYLNIDVVLFGSCSQLIMMRPKVDPYAERGARMWNRDILRNRVSLVKNSNDNVFPWYREVFVKNCLLFSCSAHAPNFRRRVWGKISCLHLLTHFYWALLSLIHKLIFLISKTKYNPHTRICSLFCYSYSNGQVTAK